MLTYIKSIFHYFFPDNSIDESDHEKQQFLAEQLVHLELTEQETNGYDSSPPEIPRGEVCYERTGIITYIGENHVLIDGMIYFDTTACSLNVQLNDKVSYLCYKDTNETVIIVRILENHGVYWGDENEAVDENTYNIKEHVFVGEVDYRQDRKVFIKNSNLKFDLDNVIATFVPIQGDWLELLCNIKFDDNKPMDVSLDLVVEVISFKALRIKVKPAVISSWDGETGSCDKYIFFDKHCILNPGEVTVGSKAIIEAIESNQGPCTWRVIKMQVTESVILDTNLTMTAVIGNKEQKSLDIENKQNVSITYPLKFENVSIKENPTINLNITNNGDQQIILNKWIMLCKKRDSQVNISPFLTRPKKIYPRSTFSMTITCHPKFFGQNKEHLILMFRGFQVERLIEVNVMTGSNVLNNNMSDQSAYYRTEIDKVNLMKNIRKNKDMSVLPGVKLIRAPNFVASKLGIFPVPQKVWNAVLGDSNETVHHVDYNKIISRIENFLPCLIQTLNISNYTDKFHTLLYMEEIQLNINMRSYDMPKAFLIRHQEYLGIEVIGLAEKRPSLIAGDKVVVKDIWDNDMPLYEGYVHLIKGDLVLVKFNPRFHETYSGSDVSIQFQFTRSGFRRSHHSINMAISNLGVDILFPSRIKTRPPQVPHEDLKTIRWFNEYLNDGQKNAVTSILLGECRPMPYCIYGPPGTGKTITVIETVLQILNLNPDSRILIATPSNSAANLVTERLLFYKKYFSSSVIRLLAHYLVDSENIPDIIKPYCATVNIAREDTIKSTHMVKNGMNLNVPASYIARHRVCIGTCYGLGTLAQLALPKGHFTHVIVDEAGQALEPEIMIALTLVDKENGQIILAGDPMQLGPVVMSKYCMEFGLDESYMSRILDTYPYQRDYHAYERGFNDKLVTRLTENYRSLEEVITLPSEMFYDSSLVAKFNRSMPWVDRLLNIVSEVFGSTDDPKTGGIFVYGIKGCNTKAEDSPSWFNPQEASMIALTVCKLFKKNVTADDIGIITPYIAQVRYLGILFDAMGLPRPKIGTVEEFQGQERAIILISTVRTTDSYVVVDQRYGLGFVKSPKRLNVALTRAHVAVLLFCDPHLLYSDPLWQKVIRSSIINNKYTGCSVPFAGDKEVDNDFLMS